MQFVAFIPLRNNSENAAFTTFCMECSAPWKEDAALRNRPAQYFHLQVMGIASERHTRFRSNASGHARLAGDIPDSIPC
ncbi:hypothetical protein G6F57_023391 [Rhizopus arrhizus]|nr:hypothetical protein G6F57_023391 [Rhizopus arrhizus]